MVLFMSRLNSLRNVHWDLESCRDLIKGVCVKWQIHILFWIKNDIFDNEIFFKSSYDICGLVSYQQGNLLIIGPHMNSPGRVRLIKLFVFELGKYTSPPIPNRKTFVYSVLHYWKSCQSFSCDPKKVLS